ncbi:MAG: methyltransferase domain-containing protein [Thaumarchaeota archaeon]|nr:methyltransferase domain-containing protein [Nitrososphaerota archaeon]MDE1831212.1 methyltransferase domain-containing protein [Nitrososphaerota archaeon]MDE1841000.1 methyltransferase domain-containing protein [Nitrososphaerota archaeon]MDE1877616.1 methyltransferase domain-containing protein [Nitrososphaerota archaeon]
MSSFFVLQKQYEDLARDEIITISKSYDLKSTIKSNPRLVMVSSKIPWYRIAGRATFVRYSGIIAGTFNDVTKIDPQIPVPQSFVCRTINLTSKNIGSSALERQVGGILSRKWGSRVSLSDPQITVYLIITDSEKYLGYSDSNSRPKFSTKIIKHPHELDMKLARCIVNLSGLKEKDTICDPFCGTGTILLEAESMGINSIGIDFDKIMCKITRKNLAANGFDSRVINSGYEEIQNIMDKIDAIVTDLPYGISSRSSVSPKKLIQDFVSVIPKRKKLVMVYKKGLEVEEISKAKKYEIYRHKSLTRVIAVR